MFLPHKDKESNAYDMGLLNKVLVGGIAAFVLWGLYGPFSSLSLGTDKMSIALTIRDVAGSILTGLGGGRLLTIEIDKQNLQVSRNQLVDKIVEVSRNQLVD